MNKMHSRQSNPATFRSSTLPHASSEAAPSLTPPPPLSLSNAIILSERYAALHRRVTCLENELVSYEDFCPAGAVRSVEEWRKEKVSANAEMKEATDALAPLFSLLSEHFIFETGSNGIFASLGLSRPPQEILASCISPFIEDIHTAVNFTFGEFGWLPPFVKKLEAGLSTEDRAFLASALIQELHTPLKGRDCVVEKFGDKFPPLNTPQQRTPVNAAFDLAALGLWQIEEPRPEPKSRTARFLRFLLDD